MEHIITLSNGQRVKLKEERNTLVLCSVDPDDTDWYICAVVPDGVLVYPNSGTAPEWAVRELKAETPPALHADNKTTPHNRTIHFTNIPDPENKGYMKELFVTVNYVDGLDTLTRAVTLDSVIIPAMIAAINAHQ